MQLWKVFFLALILHACPALAEVSRGWRCQSKVAGACEQGIFNEVERRAAVHFKATQNPYALSLRSLRIGEYLVTAYLEGDLTLGNKKKSSLRLELTFEPGSDVEGTVIPSLGRVRYGLGDGLVDLDTKRSFWIESNSDASTVKRFYTDALKEAFRKSVRQASGLDPGESLPQDPASQSCWRGCGKLSDERRFHELTVLAQGVMAARSKVNATVPLQLSCFYYRPNGISTYNLPHFEGTGKVNVTVNIPYSAHLIPGSIELFTNSAQTILEGQIEIAGGKTQLQFSSSHDAGLEVEGNVIPGFGLRWNPVGGPDASPFWERNDFDIDVFESLPIFHKEESGGRYPREVHCFIAGTEPSFAPLENPAEYEKLNLRNKKVLPRNIAPLMEQVNTNVVNSFNYAVKVYSKIGKLSKEEFGSYYTVYFKTTLNAKLAALGRSSQESTLAINERIKADAAVLGVVDESKTLLENNNATVDQLLTLNDKLLLSMKSGCATPSNALEVAEAKLNLDFDDFLQFKDDSAIVFAMTDTPPDHAKEFATLSPSIDSIEKLLGTIDSIHNADTPCQKLAKALTGVYLKIDWLRASGNQDALAKISQTAAYAIKGVAQTKAKLAADSRLAALYEQKVQAYNTAVADLSYASGSDALVQLDMFLKESVESEARALTLSNDAEKDAVRNDYARRVQVVTGDFGDFLSDAGGSLGLVKMRIDSNYHSAADRARSALANKNAAIQKTLLAAWLKAHLDQGVNLPTLCLDPAHAFGSEACWSIPAPKAGTSDKDLKDFDRRLGNIIVYAQRTGV